MACRIAVDAMGGADAPGVIVRGAVQAVAQQSDIELFLVGDERRIRSELAVLNGVGDHVQVVHASSPVETHEHDGAPASNRWDHLSHQGDSSLLQMIRLGADGRVDAMVSAADPMACAAACQVKIPSLPGVTSPALAATLTTFDGPLVLCDIGANVHARPEHLYEYAIMASLYAERMLSIDAPRVALLSVGEQGLRCGESIRRAHALLAADDRVRFVGKLDLPDLFCGTGDSPRPHVAVCDGFLGGAVLRLAEGVARGLLRAVARGLGESATDRSGKTGASLADLWRVIGQRFQAGDSAGHQQVQEACVAPLLGIDGICIVYHPPGSEQAVRNAVLSARRLRRSGYNDAVVARLNPRE